MQIMDTHDILHLSESFAAMLRELCSQRNMAEAEINEIERELDNIVHRIERNDCGYLERNRLATRMAVIRRERRALKDWMKLNRPYFEYIGSNSGEQIQKMLSNMVSVGRRVEKAKAAQSLAIQAHNQKGGV